jgi:cyanophycinase-like exopeptidase
MYFWKITIAVMAIFLAGNQRVFGQGYVSYFTGDTTDVSTATIPGLVLMGGSVENDSAMVWWLKKAGGGDVLVIRASGSDGYNDYLYSELGQSVNSVETLVFNNREASFHPYVRRRIAECEALWIAGGDQARYVNFWKDSPVDSLIQALALEKLVPIGGTSAGMAILGEAYFGALNGSVTSATALMNPYSDNVTLGNADFLDLPFLQNTITDTHFDNPDRRGRLVTFLARLYTDDGFPYRGIASEERTAVCIEPDGKARVFGNNPATEFAWFVQVNCASDSMPEVCQMGQPLTWIRNQDALKVCKIPGTNTGQHFFDLNDWETQSGGSWENWTVSAGSLNTSSSGPIDCITASASLKTDNRLVLFPLPLESALNLQSDHDMQKICIWDMTGRLFLDHQVSGNRFQFETRELPPGVYRLGVVLQDGEQENRLLVKK